MLKYNKKYFWIIGLAVWIISFLLLIIGVGIILESRINMQNIISFVVLSFILSGVSSAFYFFKFKIGLIFFIICAVIGFFEMYSMFINGMGGWGDLAGFLSLLLWSAIGLISAVLAQLLYYLFKKFKKDRKD